METPQKPTIKEQKTPFVLVELLVYGIEDEREKIKKMLDKLQEQMGKTKQGKYARVLWYIDKGEKTNEEKKEWLIENANARYNIFTPEDYHIKPDYVKVMLGKIKKFSTALEDLKGAGVTFSKKKPIKEEVENNLKVVK
jgi:hypothetical protein